LRVPLAVGVEHAAVDVEVGPIGDPRRQPGVVAVDTGETGAVAWRQGLSRRHLEDRNLEDAGEGFRRRSGMESMDDATLDEAGRDTVASYATYIEAQRAVDALSDAGFPVDKVDIVGHGLRLVERVTGRLTTARAAGAGALSGAWFGLFIGLLVGLFTSGPEWLGLVLGGLLIGAFWGAAFGFVAHWMTRGQRDFSSVRGLVASRYDVSVQQDQAQRARELLGSLR
jgi:hypothetical protein